MFTVGLGDFSDVSRLIGQFGLAVFPTTPPASRLIRTGPEALDPGRSLRVARSLPARDLSGLACRGGVAIDTGRGVANRGTATATVATTKVASHATALTAPTMKAIAAALNAAGDPAAAMGPS